ncbi:MAG: hypothetical protein HY725_11745 [Candidatus Rokubacteria bacterium]|nr:hypothetical protein [Candidatus Rokubacteria bacterium]
MSTGPHAEREVLAADRDREAPPSIGGRITNAAARERWDEIDIAPDGDPLQLLEDGELVDVVVVGARVRTFFRAEQCVELRCRVMRDGEPRFIETPSGPVPLELPAYFRLPRRRRDGRTIAPRRSRFYVAWALAAGRQPTRRDRMRLTVFKHRLLAARTRIVKTSSKDPKRELPKSLWHSVVDEFLS